jgi:CRISPR-associated protein Cas5t
MEVLRIKITGVVSSFRNPFFVSGAQPTLEVPPPSTILGIISAVAGRIVRPDEISFGYVFLYKDEGEDLELIYELSLKEKFKAKSNVIRRDFLTFPELYLYVTNVEYEGYFRKPSFPILLGRTQELAKIEKIERVTLVKTSPVRFGKTVVPIDFKGVSGAIVALPLYFDYSPQGVRKAMMIQPFVVLSRFINYERQPLWFDEEKNWGGISLWGKLNSFSFSFSS